LILQLSKLICLTEFTYTEEQLLQMERKILMSLDFDLKIPLITQYLEFYMLHERELYLSKVTTVCHFLSNLALTNIIFTNRLSSSLAAVILTFSKMILYLFTSASEFESVYDAHLFEVEGFTDILKEIWDIFIQSITSKSLFKVYLCDFTNAFC
jgi:hypothetical protein